MKETKPYGSWISPITSQLIVSRSIGLAEVSSNGEDLLWLELRPQEKGRGVLVRQTKSGEREELNHSPLNVRTRVHEYGGGAYCLQGETVFFSNDADSRVYRLDFGNEPHAITPKATDRYADFDIASSGDRLFCVKEVHNANEVFNSICLIETKSEGPGKELVSGSDFYASPRISPNGRQLCWVSWNHPNMPWDETELWVANLSPEGELSNPRKIAGTTESIVDPKWGPDGSLYFVSDRNNWWNLYRWDGDKVHSVHERAAEFAFPHWVFGRSRFCFLDEAKIACSYTEKGGSKLGILNTKSGELEEIQIDIPGIEYLCAYKDRLLVVSGSPSHPSSVGLVDLSTGSTEVLKQSCEPGIEKAYFSVPESLTFPTANGKEAHALYYKPQNRDFDGSKDEKPPLIVLSHGGPTASASATFNLKIQYWTSRGFAIVDVNYGGSTGYGRDYRNRLQDNWGVVDVQDCENAAKFLVDQGLADPERIAIKGGSAGGYTTLKALTSSKVFRAGASYFGVSHLEALAKDSHKFESRYLDKLIGPYPEALQIYEDRSPINHIDGFDCPVIFFQGLEDKVVPPNQAEMMVEALKKKGIPVAYIPFEGEQHGFRQAQNIKRALEAELYFYSKVFDIALAEQLSPVEIINAD